MVWLKLKLSICGLKPHDASVPLDSFLSYLILYFYVFCIFRGKRQKWNKIIYLAIFLILVGYKTLTEQILSA